MPEDQTPSTNQVADPKPRQASQQTQATKSESKPEPASQKPRQVLKPIDDNKQTAPEKGSAMSKKKVLPTIAIVLVVILLGVGTGYVLTVKTSGTAGPGGLRNEPGLEREVEDAQIKVGTKVGIADERTFKDIAEGKLEKGGVDGEGSHHLVRPGGESQTIYMTSSVIDLDQFVGRKVKVWGETFSAQKAGWLMDVGKMEVLQ